jgi:hypothetical protein
MLAARERAGEPDERQAERERDPPRRRRNAGGRIPWTRSLRFAMLGVRAETMLIKPTTAPSIPSTTGERSRGTPLRVGPGCGDLKCLHGND